MSTLRRTSLYLLVICSQLAAFQSHQPQHSKRVIPCVQLMRRILESEEERVEQDVVALAINLALSESIAKSICFAGGSDPTGRGLRMLLKRAFKQKDTFLLKMIRNISFHKDPDIRMLFVVRSSPFTLFPFSHPLHAHLSLLFSQLQSFGPIQAAPSFWDSLSMPF